MNVAASLDTNVLVRLVVNDDTLQHAAVRKMLSQHIRRAQALFVPITVVLELEWVLRSCYKFGKPAILNVLSSLLQTVELVFESENAVEQALITFEEEAADFADCLHLALARTAFALPFLTFDSKASNQLGAKLLK
ncbi:MAG: type II toxin-antitoxin system VapC family toxin [Rhodoferax sp.]